MIFLVSSFPCVCVWVSYCFVVGDQWESVLDERLGKTMEQKDKLRDQVQYCELLCVDVYKHNHKTSC